MILIYVAERIPNIIIREDKLMFKDVAFIRTGKDLLGRRL